MKWIKYCKQMRDWDDFHLKFSENDLKYIRWWDVCTHDLKKIKIDSKILKNKTFDSIRNTSQRYLKEFNNKWHKDGKFKNEVDPVALQSDDQIGDYHTNWKIIFFTKVYEKIFGHPLTNDTNPSAIVIALQNAL